MCIRDSTKVVQKYIERTFLLKLPGPSGQLELRKFDLRQWVLVTSFSPLVIYMFNSCYFKICGSEFTLEDVKDRYRHISNFSIQKNNERVGNTRNELVMSVPQFTAHLKEHYRVELDWEKEMMPKLGEIIKNTIYAGWDVIEHRSNCFELFGFDFVLDYKLNPWLIEVNRSPACSERTDWLVEMLGTFLNDHLESMADGLLDIIQPRLNRCAKTSVRSSEYHWVKIYDMREELRGQLSIESQCFDLKGNNLLEVVGTKLNLRIDKKIDKEFRIVHAIETLSRNVR
eukprot:TRINITY_DN3530_c0_g1_i1.p1 TRINITY_DN3530_c0_g1~~TRINITY_DN3530_c0_g1_i1.p1  ORF type:complete len:285 (+),score=72.26 TRINITY_DN3530_c0_g1_i1:73-927(+)